MLALPRAVVCTVNPHSSVLGFQQVTFIGDGAEVFTSKSRFCIFAHPTLVRGERSRSLDLQSSLLQTASSLGGNTNGPVLMEGF